MRGPFLDVHPPEITIMSFTWQTMPHAFSSLFHDVVVGARKVETVLQYVQKNQAEIEAITGLIDPGAALIEQIAFGALGEVVGAVHSVGQAAAVNGVNLTLDATAVADIKNLIALYPQIVKQVEAAKLK
jgi:hypothetical protein